MARALLLEHAVRSLPVVDRAARVVGAVGLRELSRPGLRVRDLMSEARTVAPDAPALRLIDPLTDGRTHAVVVVDANRRAVGIVTQTDLLAAISRSRDSSSAKVA